MTDRSGVGGMDGCMRENLDIADALGRCKDENARVEMLAMVLCKFESMPKRAIRDLGAMRATGGTSSWSGKLLEMIEQLAKARGVIKENCHAGVVSHGPEFSIYLKEMKRKRISTEEVGNKKHKKDVVDQNRRAQAVQLQSKKNWCDQDIPCVKRLLEDIVCNASKTSVKEVVPILGLASETITDDMVATLFEGLFESVASRQENCQILVGLALYPRIVNLKKPATRALRALLGKIAASQPMACVKAILVPMIVAGMSSELELNAFQIDIVNTMMALVNIQANDFCTLVFANRSSMALTRGTVPVFVSIFKKSPCFLPGTTSKLVDILARYNVFLNENADIPVGEHNRFSTLLFFLVSKVQGVSFDPEVHFPLIETILDSSKGVMIQAARKKFAQLKKRKPASK
mmetsp:Transcript_21266/g.34573  ORF Transcript_21266/g.34573 Transcript_21266/m.34573 type:complete len:404 (+) Transcript_21266:2513-3724(+)|eukprot:CAMPEP_0203762720 /NCGR_PEP_ID=MMETSP0098-20131031/15534_1 /ASSEMBLY_ACC=CAM_ASM_000208 /TAXON_ID=96639 /ORGANISM=" , Strain NY0313808BC1" /LENGTH=403 /DNA_ID=CAMNT_0050657233 /DNA_START=2447 /DNA_END=3658 /DNA_ORIENTATION=-